MEQRPVDRLLLAVGLGCLFLAGGIYARGIWWLMWHSVVAVLSWVVIIMVKKPRVWLRPEWHVAVSGYCLVMAARSYTIQSTWYGSAAALVGAVGSLYLAWLAWRHRPQ